MRTMITAWVLAGVLGLGVGLGAAVGCNICNEGICSSIAWVYFDEPDGGPLEDGSYHVEVTIDGVLDEATCTVANGATDLHCDGLEYVLYAPLYGGADNPHDVLELFFEDDPPEALDVRITHATAAGDGVVLFDMTIEPDYELAEPRPGKSASCDDDCYHAMSRFDFAR